MSTAIPSPATPASDVKMRRLKPPHAARTIPPISMPTPNAMVIQPRCSASPPSCSRTSRGSNEKAGTRNRLMTAAMTRRPMWPERSPRKRIPSIISRRTDGFPSPSAVAELLDGCGTRTSRSGRIAKPAVTTSIAMTHAIGSAATRKAPIGAAMMLRPPCRPWLKPWIRVRCSFGTIREVEAIIAGWWNASATARTKIRIRMCVGFAMSMINITARSAAASAAVTSAKNITRFRLQRSISGPINGPIKAIGRRAKSVAIARIVADPVSTVSHQTRANWTACVPSSDIAWPDHKKKNGFMERCSDPAPESWLEAGELVRFVSLIGHLPGLFSHSGSLEYT